VEAVEQLRLRQPKIGLVSDEVERERSAFWEQLFSGVLVGGLIRCGSCDELLSASFDITVFDGNEPIAIVGDERVAAIELGFMTPVSSQHFHRCFAVMMSGVGLVYMMGSHGSRASVRRERERERVFFPSWYARQ
jgi:hypothetical protein